MISNSWVAILSQQYEAIDKNPPGIDFLLAVRRFVQFLEDNPQARRYTSEMEFRWERSYKEWFRNCESIKKELLRLETKIRDFRDSLAKHINSLESIPSDQEFLQNKHILDKIAERDWFSAWEGLSDDLDLNSLHISKPRQTKTGHMVSSVLSKTRALERFTKALDYKVDTAQGFREQLENLWGLYGVAGWKIKNDWMSSGKHGLDQLRVTVSIMDGEIFVDPSNLKHPKVNFLKPWMLLLAMYAPSSGVKKKCEWYINHDTAAMKNFENDLLPFIQSYLK